MLFDQMDFPCPIPFLELFFSLNPRQWVTKNFIVDKALYVVRFSKAVSFRVFVLINS